MKDKLIVIHKNRGRVSTFLIAKGFQRKHEHVLRLVKRYQKDFELIMPLVVAVEKRGRGKKSQEFLLSEEQFIFLATLFKNSKTVIDFKRTLAVQFVKVSRLLISAKAQHTDQKWIMSRDFGKEQRLEATNSIKDFAEYAKSQGSKNADRYYTIISRMTNGLLFMFVDKFKNLREVLTAKQLITIASAEQIISKSLKDGMKAKTFYKDIYKQIRKNVLIFAELHGQSKVIEDQLLIDEKQ